MKIRIISLFAITSLLFTSLFIPYRPSVASVQSKSSQESAPFEKGSVIVTLLSPENSALSREGTSSFDSNIEISESWDFGDCTFLASDTATEEFLSDKVYYISYIKSDKYSTTELIDKLEDKAYVANVSPNYIYEKSSVSNDSYIEKQWYQSENSGVGASKLWETSDNSKSPVVAVVDTGIDYTHEDLSSNMWTNPYLSQGLPGNYGYDYGDKDSDPMDDDGHGTHCAGIIAGTLNNNTGIAGISNNAKLMALKIFDSEGTADTSGIISAFEYIYQAQTLGTNIVAVNCSWGGGSSGNSLKGLVAKIGEKGALFSFASGNDGTQVSSSDGTPFDIGSEYIITTGASTEDKQACNFSCYSSLYVDLFAPGCNILSTVSKETFLPDIYDETKREQLTTVYDTGDSETEVAKYAIGRSSILGGNATLESDPITYEPSINFPESIGGSYRWDATRHTSSRINYFMYDVTDLNLDTKKTYYISLMMGTKDGNQIDWTHSTFVSKNTATGNRFTTMEGKTYLKLVGLQASTTTSTGACYIDNIAISTANPDTSAFGKYDYSSGTSMAAPMVTGAIALLAQNYPDDTIAARRSRLLSSVSTSSTLSSKCATGGILDLAKAKIYQAPLPSSITLKASSQNVKVKKTITITSSILPVTADQTVLYSINNTNYATIDATGRLTAKTKGAGKSVRITAFSKSNSSVSASITIQIQKQKVTKVKLNKSKLTLKAGHTVKLRTTTSPSYANNKKLKWSSSNKAYAKVNQKGLVRALKKGIGKTVKIYAKATDGSKKKAILRLRIRK